MKRNINPLFRQNINITVLMLLLLMYGCVKDTPEIPKEQETISLQTLSAQISPTITVKNGSSINYNDSLIVIFSNNTDSVFTIEENGSIRKIKFVIEQITILNEGTKEKIDNARYYVENDKKNLRIELSTLRGANYNYKIFLTFNFVELNMGEWKSILNTDGTFYNNTVEMHFNTKPLPSDIKNCTLDGIRIIKEIKTTDNASANLSLNYGYDKEIKATKDSRTTVLVRGKIEKIELLHKGVTVESISNWLNTSNCTILPTGIMQSKESYQIRVTSSYEEASPNGWIKLLDANGAEIKDEYLWDFTSKEYDTNSFPASLIKYTYPISRQFNFYKNEYKKGYIEFFYNPTLISQIGNKTVTFEFLQLPQNDVAAQVTGSIEESTKTIWFDIPQNLQNETPYRLRMLIDGSVVYQIEFRVSKYNTFIEKLPTERSVRFLYNLDSFEGMQKPNYIGSTIYPKTAPDECFDYYEIEGVNSVPLIQISALLDEWDWYQTSLYKAMYETVARNSTLSIKRTDFNGEPTQPINIWQIDYSRKLTDEEISTGKFTYEAEFSHLVNYIPGTWALDYKQIRTDLLAKYSNVSLITDPTLASIYSKPYFPYPQPGKYNLLLEYKLPGKQIVTTSHKIIITNDIELKDIQ